MASIGSDVLNRMSTAVPCLAPATPTNTLLRLSTGFRLSKRTLSFKSLVHLAIVTSLANPCTPLEGKPSQLDTADIEFHLACLQRERAVLRAARYRKCRKSEGRREDDRNPSHAFPGDTQRSMSRSQRGRLNSWPSLSRKEGKLQALQR